MAYGLTIKAISQRLRIPYAQVQLIVENSRGRGQMSNEDILKLVAKGDMGEAFMSGGIKDHFR